MSARRCNLCQFWVFGAQYGVEAELERHPDDQRGECHRHAPRPTLGEFEYAVLYFFGMAIECDEKDSGFPEWEEFHAVGSTWPTTEGADWCGDFQPKGGEAVTQ